MVRKSLMMIAAAMLVAAPVTAQAQNSSRSDDRDNRDRGGWLDGGQSAVRGTPTAALVAALVIWLLAILVATNNGNGPRQTSP